MEHALAIVALRNATLHKNFTKALPCCFFFLLGSNYRSTADFRGNSRSNPWGNNEDFNTAWLGSMLLCFVTSVASADDHMIDGINFQQPFNIQANLASSIPGSTLAITRK